MKRLIVSIFLSLWVLLMGTLAYGLGDYQYPLETWLISFSLPIWSLMTIGLWYDTGRLLIGSLLDSKESTTPNWLRSLAFITYMAFVFTYVVWVHISVHALQMLILIPLLGIPLNNLLIRDWDKIEMMTPQQVWTVLGWSAVSYLTYWTITFGWVILRVWLLDATGECVIFYIR